MWTSIRNFFKDSEVIFIARMKTVVGALITVLAQYDPHLLAPIIPDNWFGIYLLVAGVVIEVARRARDEQMKKGN